MIRQRVNSVVHSVNRVNFPPISKVGEAFVNGTGAYAVCIGSLILWGGDIRFHGPALEVLASWARYYVWGYLPIIFGIVILTSTVLRNWWVKLAGLGLFSMWTTAVASGAMSAMFAVPTSGVTGGPTYFYVTFIVIGLVFVKYTPDAKDSVNAPTRT